MRTITIQTGWLKLLIGWAAVFIIRLLPFRPANFEPMLATMMPFATRFGFLTSFLFGFLGITLFDAMTSGIGSWTLVTAAAYGALGVGAHLYFARREATTKNFLAFGIVGTLLYDLVTGLTVGPLFFGQPFMLAVVGQIPFTLMHLLGTVVFTLALSPALYRWVVRNDALEFRLGWGKVRA
ncbi:MAG TPA: hypothetical protein VGB97_03765 [Candidatus Paceibacterota bacterium]|jgi:uncharacterized membrane protein